MIYHYYLAYIFKQLKLGFVVYNYSELLMFWKQQCKYENDY